MGVPIKTVLPDWIFPWRRAPGGLSEERQGSPPRLRTLHSSGSTGPAAQGYFVSVR